jgi:hypothetical protein
LEKSFSQGSSGCSFRFDFLGIRASGDRAGTTAGGKTGASAQQSGMGTRLPACLLPVHDAENRPITAGGFVDSGPIVFQDISKQAGLTAWHHKMGSPEKKYILETPGSGVALLDYDNDGWLDIYVVNGSTYEALDGKEPAPNAALFHNNHDGTFTDVAAKAGVTNDRWGFGAAVGTSTTTAGQTSTSATTARTASTATITTGPSPTSRKRRASRGRMVGRGDIWRLRRRRQAGYLRAWVRALRPQQPARSRIKGGQLFGMPVPRDHRNVRPARIAGRERPSLPQQRRRHLHRHL